MHGDVMTWLVPLVSMLAAGLFAGFAAGIFGIGGGFVVVPALFVVLPLLGGTHDAIAHVAIGTSAATIIVTSIRSLLSHAKRGAVEFEILKTWAPWIILGDGMGVLLAGHVDGRILTMIFAGGVFLMSLNFLLPKVGDKVISQDMPSGIARVGIAGGLGTFSALLGIGGGTIAIMVMTLPVMFPILVHSGFDPIWLGVISVKLAEISLLTPPVGLNVYVVRSSSPIPLTLEEAFTGVTPFILIDVVTLGLLIAFPAISLYLPSLMAY